MRKRCLVFAAAQSMESRMHTLADRFLTACDNSGLTSLDGEAFIVGAGTEFF